MRDVKLFISELERTLLLILVSVNKSFEIVFQFSHLCGFGYLSYNIFCLKIEKDPTVFEPLNER